MNQSKNVTFINYANLKHYKTISKKEETLVTFLITLVNYILECILFLSHIQKINKSTCFENNNAFNVKCTVSWSWDNSRNMSLLHVFMYLLNLLEVRYLFLSFFISHSNLSNCYVFVPLVPFIRFEMWVVI